MIKKNHISLNYLANFEKEIKTAYEKGKIRVSIHLSGNNEIQLINIFKKIFKEIDIVNITKPNQVFQSYKKALTRKDSKSTLLIEKSF